jgi:hypothetical protein
VLIKRGNVSNGKARKAQSVNIWGRCGLFGRSWGSSCRSIESITCSALRRRLVSGTKTILKRRIKRTIRICSKRRRRQIITVSPVLVSAVPLRLTIARKDGVHVLLISAALEHLTPVVLVFTTLVLHGIVVGVCGPLVIHRWLITSTVHGPLAAAVVVLALTRRLRALHVGLSRGAHGVRHGSCRRASGSRRDTARSHGSACVRSTRQASAGGCLWCGWRGVTCVGSSIGSGFDGSCLRFLFRKSARHQRHSRNRD